MPFNVCGLLLCFAFVWLTLFVICNKKDISHPWLPANEKLWKKPPLLTERFGYIDLSLTANGHELQSNGTCSAGTRVPVPRKM